LAADLFASTPRTPAPPDQPSPDLREEGGSPGASPGQCSAPREGSEPQSPAGQLGGNSLSPSDPQHRSPAAQVGEWPRGAPLGLLSPENLDLLFGTPLGEL
jgi:hypothetical protein